MQLVFVENDFIILNDGFQDGWIEIFFESDGVVGNLFFLVVNEDGVFQVSECCGLLVYFVMLMMILFLNMVEVGIGIEVLQVILYVFGGVLFFLILESYFYGNFWIFEIIYCYGFSFRSGMRFCFIVVLGGMIDQLRFDWNGFVGINV